jgi:Flp pilus assembly pilin Flp
MFLRKHKGQSILEYAILIAIIIAAILVMQTFMKRGVQGRLKDSSDRISGGDSFSASESTVLEDRAMTTNRNIHEETSTTDMVRTAIGTGFLNDAVDTQGIGNDAYTGSAVTGGTSRSITQTKMSGASNEAYTVGDYGTQNATTFEGADEITANSVFTGEL